MSEAAKWYVIHTYSGYEKSCGKQKASRSYP